MPDNLNVFKCRSIENLPGCEWVAVHLGLLIALDLGTMLALVVADGGSASDWFGGVVIAVVWTLPWHVVMLVVALLQLAVLDLLAPDLSRIAFRVTALTVFTAPAFGYAWLIADPDYAQALLVVLPMHVVMGLLVVQRGYHYANALPN